MHSHENPRAAAGPQGSPAKSAGCEARHKNRKTTPCTVGFVVAAPALSPRGGLFRRALRSFGEPGRDRRGLFTGSPARRIAAVAPFARPVEGVDAGLVHPLHLIDPGR